MDPIYSPEKSYVCHITCAAKQTWACSPPLRLNSKAHAQRLHLCKPHYLHLLQNVQLVMLWGWGAPHWYRPRWLKWGCLWNANVSLCVGSEQKIQSCLMQNTWFHFTKKIQICQNVIMLFLMKWKVAVLSLNSLGLKCWKTYIASIQFIPLTCNSDHCRVELVQHIFSSSHFMWIKSPLLVVKHTNL